MERVTLHIGITFGGCERESNHSCPVVRILLVTGKLTICRLFCGFQHLQGVYKSREAEFLNVYIVPFHLS